MLVSLACGDCSTTNSVGRQLQSSEKEHHGEL